MYCACCDVFFFRCLSQPEKKRGNEARHKTMLYAYTHTHICRGRVITTKYYTHKYIHTYTVVSWFIETS